MLIFNFREKRMSREIGNQHSQAKIDNLPFLLVDDVGNRLMRKGGQRVVAVISNECYTYGHGTIRAQAGMRE